MAYGARPIANRAYGDGASITTPVVAVVITPTTTTVAVPGGYALGGAPGQGLVTTYIPPQTITTTGIASTEAIGTVTTIYIVSSTGIVTAEAVGAPALLAVISPTGLNAAGGVGVPDVAAITGARITYPVFPVNTTYPTLPDLVGV